MYDELLWSSFLFALNVWKLALCTHPHYTKEENNLQIKFTNRGNTLILSVVGELDHHSAEYIRQKADAEIIKSTTKNLIFDFSKVNFMDSSGIGVIMGRYKYIQQLNGRACFVNVNPQIQRIFEMAGLFKIIPRYDSIDTAINNM